MLPYQGKDTSVPWQMVCPVKMPWPGSTSCRYENFCNIRTWWYAQKVWMANLKPCILPSRSCPFGTLPYLANLSMNHSWYKWTSAACNLRTWQLAFSFPYCTSTTFFSSWYCGASQWHHCGHQPAAPRGLGMAAEGFPCSLNPCFPAQYAEERVAISGPGAPPSTAGAEDSPWGMGGWAQSSSPQWQPLHRCLHVWPQQTAPLASLTPLTHCSSSPYQRHWRWWASPLSHSLRPPPRVRPAGLSESDELLQLQEKDECGPRCNYSQPGPLLIPTAESWNLTCRTCRCT